MCILAAFVPVPRTILVLGAGAAFGLKALLVIVPSTTFGCILAFLLARGLLRNWGRQTGRRWRVNAQAIDDEGRRIAALMRFCGPAPNCARPAFQPMGRADDRLSGFAADTDDPYR
jgi:uncharacterized membrane protein YdjX (TVP38/TMEM64 family)